MADPILDSSTSIADFLSATAAKRPAPGGGAVAALSGALCAAIGEMVLNYSVGRKGNTPDADAKLTHTLGELTRARAMMLELVIEDQGAFTALSTARKASGNRGDSDPAFAAALLACIRIPQAIGATAASILQLAGEIVPIANHFLLSDLGVCAELAMATVRCAAWNVRVNLADVSDAAERDRFEQSTAALVSKAASRVKEIIPAIIKRQQTSR